MVPISFDVASPVDCCGRCGAGTDRQLCVTAEALRVNGEKASVAASVGAVTPSVCTTCDTTGCSGVDVENNNRRSDLEIADLISPMP